MQKKLALLMDELRGMFPERRDVILGMVIAVLIKEHVLLLGPPGTAKSSMVRTLAQAFGVNYWERLLTRFTVMEEVWGPVSLRGLEVDKYIRATTGKLAEAQIAFIDEVGRANSSVLNSLLSAMVERLFHNDSVPTAIPLISMFGATNSIPDQVEAEALWDRFILKYSVDYLLRPSNLRKILLAPSPMLTTRLTFQELQIAQAEVEQVKISDATLDAMLAIRDSARSEGIVASDRRWVKCIQLVKGNAYISGESEACPEDLTILIDSLWREPQQRSKISRLVGAVADPVSAQATAVLDAARETAQKVATMQNVGDRKDYITAAAQSLQEFKQQEARLNDLARNAGRRAQDTIREALTEVRSLHSEIARNVSQGLGLGVRAVK